MTATKRSRREVEEDSEEEEEEEQVLEVQEASSSFRQESARKRARIFDAPAPAPASKKPVADGEASSSSESESDDDGAFDDGGGGGGDSPPRTQYEMLRDRDYSHLQHEAKDDMRATQKVVGRFGQSNRRVAENRAADNGIIEMVTCINFMCHSCLKVELGPLLNFVVGENGSGKSAVLTAITLCLGAKASSTNRGGSLKSFIKEGQEHSSIQVKLKNQGEGAYQHDVYGDSITVERHFSKNGSSGFKLKNTAGRIISLKKRDVDEMVEYFCLQMDNPLNVLSQDNARQFLNASTPSLKYKYFVQGVQLEALDNDYKLVMQTAENIEEKLAAASDHVKRLELQYDDAKKLLESVKTNQQTREKRRLFRNQLVWLQVVAEERSVSEIDGRLTEVEGRIATAEQKTEQASQVLEVTDGKLARAKEALEKAQEEKAAFEDQEKTAREEYNTAREEVRIFHQEERLAGSRLKAAKANVTQLKDQIEEEERRLSEATGEGRAQKEQARSAAEEKVARLAEKLTENRAQSSGLKHQAEDAKKKVQARKEAVESKKGEIRSTQQRIYEARRSRGSEFAGFDPNTPQLLNMIEKEGGFEHEPVGPVGRYLRLLKPEWLMAIERTLGSTPNAYIVQSQSDSVRLRGMIRRARVRNAPVIISTGRGLNLTGKEPDGQYDTILRVLDISSPLVRDQLIINHRIEQTVLVPKRSDAERIMFDQKPRNVAICFTHHDGKQGEDLRLQATPRSNSTDPVTPWTGPPRLRTDGGVQTQHLEKALAHQNEQLRDLLKQAEEAEAENREAELAMKRNVREREALSNEKRLAEADLDNLRAELDQYESDDAMLSSLRDDLKKAEEKLEHEGTQLGNMSTMRDPLNKTAERLLMALKTEKRKAKVFDDKVQAEQAKVNNMEDARSLHVSSKNRAYEELDLARAEKRSLQRKREEQVRVAQEIERQAREQVPDRVHIPEDENEETITKKYKRLGEQLRQFEQHLGASEEEVAESATRTQTAYDVARRQCDNQKRLLFELKRSLDERLKRWRQFQRYLSARTRVNFGYLLTERAMRGKMHIDHRNRRLALQVEPDETQRSATGRQTKTLSGGEKSFASICMLLSIWEAMGSSIRCLDEFDVFMDNVNRAIATNMLISAARRSVSRQYILITPNAIEGRAELGNDVKIIRLGDPRQRTITSMQQNGAV